LKPFVISTNNKMIQAIPQYYQCYFCNENRSRNAQSDPKFGRRGGGVSYIDARQKRFWNPILACILLRNFQNGVPAHTITKIPLSARISEHPYTDTSCQSLLPNAKCEGDLHVCSLHYRPAEQAVAYV
jgi:hypothetical protein